MKVNDIIIVANLGEIKVYKANPRTLEAEAGLKETEIKLDLIRDIDIIESHKKLQDLVTGLEGSFKPGFLKHAATGEKHNLKEAIYNEVIKTVAEDIDSLIEENNSRVFLALPKFAVNDILGKIKNKTRIVKVVEKDLVKTDKNKLIDEFKSFGK